jgi:hypothetical protein
VVYGSSPTYIFTCSSPQSDYHSLLELEAYLHKLFLISWPRLEYIGRMPICKMMEAKVENEEIAREGLELEESNSTVGYEAEGLLLI